MTRQEASGTRSCSRPSRRGLAAGAWVGAVTDILCGGFYRMQNAERRTKNEESVLFSILRSAFCVLHSFCYPRRPMPRVAIVRGLRTPFAKSGTHFARLSALDLGKMVVAELIERSGIGASTVQEVVFGNVIPSV